MARTKNAARKTHGKRPMSANLTSGMKLKPDQHEKNVATTSKIFLGGFTRKKDRKRKRSASVESEVNPLNLRKFESPMASRVKKEEPMSEDLLSGIPESGKESKPPIKRMKVESTGEDVGMEPTVALEQAPKIDAVPLSWFASYPQNEGDDEQPTLTMPEAPQFRRATTTPLNTWFADAVAGIQSPQRTEEQLEAEEAEALQAVARVKKRSRTEHMKAKHEASETKKERKAAHKERLEEERAAARARKQQKAERKEANEAAASGKRQQNSDAKKELKGSGLSKAQQRLAADRDIMSKWPAERIEKHVLKAVRGQALRELRLTEDLDLVLKGLKAAQKVVRDEYRNMKGHGQGHDNREDTHGEVVINDDGEDGGKQVEEPDAESDEQPDQEHAEEQVENFSNEG